MKRPDNTSSREIVSSSPPRKGVLAYRRAPIEIDSPEQYGYENIEYNLAESSVTDMVFSELGDLGLRDLVLCYGDHVGSPALRRYIAGVNDVVAPRHVLTTAGAASALFIIMTSLLKPYDHVVVLHPNYVSNVEIPRAIGCQVDYIGLSFDEGFSLDLGKLERMIQPHTRLVSCTYPHNPTGVMISESDLSEVISIVEDKRCLLLFDETYRDMTFSQPLPIAAALSTNAISVSSFSKSYGLPGIRIGWLITQDEAMMNTFLAAKEQILICNSVVDEEIATQFLANKDKFFPKIQAHIQANFEVIKTWMTDSACMEWVEPSGGCICLPRIQPSVRIDLDRFYRTLNEKYKTFVGPGHWFEMDRRYMRIGYGWPNQEELRKGLRCIDKALAESILT